MGYVDDDGFLYLTDRATFMIISGGVNIYPQEIEDAMILHPKIADVAVVGAPQARGGDDRLPPEAGELGRRWVRVASIVNSLSSMIAAP